MGWYKEAIQRNNFFTYIKGIQWRPRQLPDLVACPFRKGIKIDSQYCTTVCSSKIEPIRYKSSFNGMDTPITRMLSDYEGYEISCEKVKELMDRRSFSPIQ